MSANISIPAPRFPDELYCAICGQLTEIDWTATASGDGDGIHTRSFDEWECASSCCGGGFTNRFWMAEWEVEPHEIIEHYEPWERGYDDEPTGGDF
ncbi:MAG: hypothetical protein JST12_14520 [Armatimonadetes bacterium]|nr:hypothetical protein [Armatimonadota bacterium]